jgi:hypothetical protein
MKSIQLAALAALAASTSTYAYAADAVVAAEPEPMEYVRVCDAFGKGYFYIPGTETCLRISGYIRAETRGGEALGRDSDNDGYGDSFDARSRALLGFSTASDTEYGALKTYAEIRFDYHGGYGGPYFASSGRNSTPQTWFYFGYIDFAGFQLGVGESNFTTYGDYAGNVMSDWFTKYGPFQTNYIAYNYDGGNGLTGVIALEDDNGTGKGYLPDFVLGAGYTMGQFGVKVIGGYDESMNEGAIKARLDGEFGGFSAFLMAGWSTDGDRREFRAGYGSNRYATWEGDYAVWGGVSAPLTEKATLNTQLSYDEAKNFAAVANVEFEIVEDLELTPELVYTDGFAPDKGSAWGGMIRLERSF